MDEEKFLAKKQKFESFFFLKKNYPTNTVSISYNQKIIDLSITK